MSYHDSPLSHDTSKSKKNIGRMKSTSDPETKSRIATHDERRGSKVSTSLIPLPGLPPDAKKVKLAAKVSNGVSAVVEPSSPAVTQSQSSTRSEKRKRSSLGSKMLTSAAASPSPAVVSTGGSKDKNSNNTGSKKKSNHTVTNGTHSATSLNAPALIATGIFAPQNSIKTGRTAAKTKSKTATSDRIRADQPDHRSTQTAMDIDNIEAPQKKRKQKHQTEPSELYGTTSHASNKRDFSIAQTTAQIPESNKRRKTDARPDDESSDVTQEKSPTLKGSPDDEPGVAFTWPDMSRRAPPGSKVPKRVVKEGRFSMHRAMNQTKVTGLRKRGELTEDEVAILEDLINDFMILNDLSIGEVQILMSPGSMGPRVKDFWRMIDEALPLRAPRHDHLVKQVRSRAYDGQRGVLDPFELEQLKEMIENEPSLPWKEFGAALGRRSDALRDYYHTHLKHMHHPGSKHSVKTVFGSWTEEEDARLKAAVVKQIEVAKRQELGLDATDLRPIDVTEIDLIDPRYYVHPTALAMAVESRGIYSTRERWKRVQWDLTRSHQRNAAITKYGEFQDPELQAISNHEIMLPADRFACLKGLLAFLREEDPPKIMRYQPSRVKKLEQYLANEWSQADAYEVLHRTEMEHPRGEYASRDTYLVKILAQYEKQYKGQLNTFYAGPPEVCLTQMTLNRKHRVELETGKKSMGLTEADAKAHVAEHGVLNRPGWDPELLGDLLDGRQSSRKKRTRGIMAAVRKAKPRSSYFVTVSDDEDSADEQRGVSLLKSGDDEETTSDSSEDPSSEEDSSDDQDSSDDDDGEDSSD